MEVVKNIKYFFKNFINKFKKEEVKELEEPKYHFDFDKNRLNNLKYESNVNLITQFKKDIEEMIEDELQFSLRVYGKAQLDEDIIRNSTDFLKFVTLINPSAYNLDDETLQSLKKDISTYLIVNYITNGEKVNIEDDKKKLSEIEENELEFERIPQSEMIKILNNNKEYKQYKKRVKEYIGKIIVREYPKIEISLDNNTLTHNSEISDSREATYRELILKKVGATVSFSNEEINVEEINSEYEKQLYKTYKTTRVKTYDKRNSIETCKKEGYVFDIDIKHARDISVEECCKILCQTVKNTNSVDWYETKDYEMYNVGTTEVIISTTENKDGKFVEVETVDDYDIKKTSVSKTTFFESIEEKRKYVREYLEKKGIIDSRVM